MQFSRTKTLLAIATIIFLMSSSIFMALGTEVNAVTTFPPIATSAWITAAPNPIGVNQMAVVNLWIQPQPQAPAGDVGTISASNVGYANVSVTIVLPDGTQDTFKPQDIAEGHIGIGPGITESGGAMYFDYVPTKVGSYTFTCSMPGQNLTETINKVNYSRYLEPSTSAPFTLTVQSTNVTGGIIDGSPYAPLPTNFWSNPVNIDNREWSAISGDWLISGYNNEATKYNPYSTAPTTAHILWDTQQCLGGLMGGQWGSDAYYGGQTCIVMNGFVYYNSAFGNTFNCIDLTTGKLVYTVPGTITRGLNLLTGYQVGAIQNEGVPVGYLINTATFAFYDPFTGALMSQMTSVPSGLTGIWWDEGSEVAYMTQNSNLNATTLQYGYIGLIAWNFTAVPTNGNWAAGLIYNVSIAQPGAYIQIDRTMTPYVYDDAGVILLYDGNGGSTLMGYNMTNGAWLWTTNTTYENQQQEGFFGCGGPDGPFVQYDAVAGALDAYNVATGAQVWTDQIVNSSDPWADIASYPSILIGDVRYTPRFDGRVYAVNMTNGATIWISQVLGGNTDETVEGNYIFGASSYAGNGEPGAAADGMLYVSQQTVYRGEPNTRYCSLFCLNAVTGAEIWNVTGAIAPTAIADGYLLGNDGDNGILYCFGKGPTATTVQAPLTDLASGAGVLISGTVLDESPAEPGTPAVSDASMTTQMNYYMQNNATSVNNPPTPTGVQVTLTALDPNGNTETIGTYTTDSNGHYAVNWTPPVPGQYSIIATFAGDDSYWSSTAETAIYVNTAASATPAPTATPTSAATMYFVPAIAALFVLIIIVAIVLALLMLRKKP